MSSRVNASGPSWYTRVITTSSRFGGKVNRVCCCGLFPVNGIKSALVRFPFIFIFLMFTTATGQFGKNLPAPGITLWTVLSTLILATLTAFVVSVVLWIIKLVSCGKADFNLNNKYGIGILLCAPISNQGQYAMFWGILLLAAKGYETLEEMFGSTATVQELLIRRAICGLCDVDPAKHVVTQLPRPATEQEKEDARHKLSNMTILEVEDKARTMGIPERYIENAIGQRTKVKGKPFSGYSRRNMDDVFRTEGLRDRDRDYDHDRRRARSRSRSRSRSPSPSPAPAPAPKRKSRSSDDRTMSRVTKAATSTVAGGKVRRPKNKPPIVDPTKYVVREEYSNFGAVVGQADIRVTAADEEEEERRSNRNANEDEDDEEEDTAM